MLLPLFLSVCSLGCVQLTEPTETLLPGAGQGIESRRKRGCGKALRLCPRGRCCVNTLRWQRCMKHSLCQRCLLSRHLWIMNWFRLSVQHIYRWGGSVSSILRPNRKKAVVVLGGGRWGGLLYFMLWSHKRINFKLGDRVIQRASPVGFFLFVHIGSWCKPEGKLMVGLACCPFVNLNCSFES